MNDAHLHLLLNHAPILGTLFGVLVLGYGWFTKSRGAIKVGLTTLLLVSLVAIPAYITGGGAEEIVEDLPGVSHEAIEAHEAVGEWALWVSGFAGTAALLGLLTISQASSRSSKARIWIASSLLLGLIAFGLMVWTGVTGGIIRHSELRDKVPVQKVDPKR